MIASDDREALAPSDNPLGLDGVEFVEYSTRKPQALGQVLESMGFRPIARHRSREVMLYRQGDMNVIVNAHGAGVAADAMSDVEASSISAIAFRVHNAAAAYAYVLERGAWAVPSQVAVMELNIPAIHGVGSSRIYFVDRYREFSIYDVDFVPIPTVEQHPAAIGRLRFFGAVQYIGTERTDDWTEFYTELFGFTPLPDDERFGVLPKGRLLRDPSGTFMLQLVEPQSGLPHVGGTEAIARLGLGTPDVPATVKLLTKNGVSFNQSEHVQPSERGALTQPRFGGVLFELVHDARS